MSEVAVSDGLAAFPDVPKPKPKRPRAPKHTSKSRDVEPVKPPQVEGNQVVELTQKVIALQQENSALRNEAQLLTSALVRAVTKLTH